MPCEPLIEHGKVVGWMCSRGRGKPKPPPCYKCGAPSTKLCDHRSMKPRYQTDDQGRKVGKVWVADIFTCDRPMCGACANHVGPDLDYCDFHNNEIAKIQSAEADALYQEQLRRLGIEEATT